MHTNEAPFPHFYKYLDVNGAKLTLQNRTFKYAKPSDFNDYEDMTITGLFPGKIGNAVREIENILIKNVGLMLILVM